jgi:glycosyltransferase involved in cell wall biosynthesis
VIFVGNFPPPVHGMSLVNAAVLDRLRARSVQPTVLNTSPTSLSRSKSVRLARLPKVLKALGTVWWIGARRPGILYMSISGGYGQIYDCLILLTARLVGLGVVAHHHSYAYLDRTKVLAAACVRAAGPEGTHVVLCNNMGKKLQARYPRATNVLVVSNAAFILDEIEDRLPRTDVRVVAFMSNISEAKGIFYFLELAERLLRRAPNSGVRALIAGPFESSEIEQSVRKLLTTLPNVEYVGPKYGNEKAHFLASVDVLLFPSIYQNEAEPLAILEAISRGIPVIASERGCIRDLITRDSGLVIQDMRQFAEAATDQLLKWISDPHAFQELSAKTLAHFNSHRVADEASFEKLCDRIAGIRGDSFAPHARE